MTAVFLSHSSKDKDIARRIASRLANHNIDVWFDEWEIRIGESITQKIEKGLKDSDFVAVVLTKHSVESKWVEKEWQSQIGEEADSGKVKILPIWAGICNIPYLLKDKRYANLVNDFDAGINELISTINSYTQEIKMQETFKGVDILKQKLKKFPVGGFETPCFFPSISGAAKNPLAPLEHLSILNALRYPLFLISAYDLEKADDEDKKTMQNYLDRSMVEGQIVLLDSGIYEKRWLRAKRWQRATFHKILRRTPCHLSFCYDILNIKKKEIDAVVNELAKSVINDREKGEMNSIIPIVHSKFIPDYPIICIKLLESLRVPMIAFAERELGEGVLEVASTIRLLRDAIDSIDPNCLIHILGAGNPLSILIYAACGAESFDGLDWCQTVVDHKTGQLYHSMQLDFFIGQTDYSDQKLLPYLTRVYAHNLVFYENWMNKIRDAIDQDCIIDLLNEFIPQSCLGGVKNILSN